MLIDDWLPEWDVRERHRLRVRAPAERVYAALRSTDFGGSPMIRAMLGLRALAAALAGGARGVRGLRGRIGEPIKLATFERAGFRVLQENPPHELVIGLEGAFWRPRGGLRPVDDATYRNPLPEGVARAAWNFAVEPDADGGSQLSTETRVAVGAGAGVPFRLYWLLIRPGSGSIRRLMLRRVRWQAEQGARPGEMDAPPSGDRRARP